MATVDVIVSNPAIRQVRQNLWWIFILIAVLGSALKELEVVPQTYFSSSKNVLNLYFVKLSWGWTLVLLTPFILLSNASFDRSALFLGRRMLSLAVATAVWYVCTETFFYIEEATGSCFETDVRTVSVKALTSKASCRRKGFHWYGHDISGHCFILAYSTLFIVEETAAITLLKTGNISALPKLVLNLLYVALNMIVLIWVWMFACTSVYFHETIHKLLGTLCGLLGWYLTYRVWYLKPWSPGLPPQRPETDQSEELQQDQDQPQQRGKKQQKKQA